MKNYLLPALLAITAYATLPHAALADQPQPPRCEQGEKGQCPPPKDGPKQDAPKQDAPPEGRKQSRGEAAPERGARPARMAQSQAQAPHESTEGWTRGAKYTGEGARVDYRRADLPAPGAHQRWLRDGDDYLLVSERTGVIAAVRPR